MITLLTDRGDNTDFPSGKISEGAHESNSYKCSDFNRKIDGNEQRNKPNWRSIDDKPNRLSVALFS